MKILITGGTGSLGQELVRALLEKGFTNLCVLARDEGNLVAFKDAFPKVQVIIGDIADKWVVKEAMTGVTGVFHLAAQKHVGLSEEFVWQTINSNVTGTTNLLDESFKVKPQFVLGVSTDKASNPTGVYGCTKLLMERLFIQAEKINKDTKYRIVRFGNLIGSTGSFLTKWKPLMQAGEEVVLTDPNATRFFWDTKEAVKFMLESLENSPNASPYIPKMKAISMGQALEACQEVYGKSPVKITGLQKGENMHETMDGMVFSNQVEQFTKEEFKQKFL